MALEGTGLVYEVIVVGGGVVRKSAAVHNHTHSTYHVAIIPTCQPTYTNDIGRKRHRLARREAAGGGRQGGRGRAAAGAVRGRPRQWLLPRRRAHLSVSAAIVSYRIGWHCGLNRPTNRSSHHCYHSSIVFKGRVRGGGLRGNGAICARGLAGVGGRDERGAAAHHGRAHHRHQVRQ